MKKLTEHLKTCHLCAVATMLAQLIQVSCQVFPLSTSCKHAQEQALRASPLQDLPS